MFKLVSDWIEIEYVIEDEEEESKPIFRYDDRIFYLDNFVRCHNNPWGNMNVPDYIHAYDVTNYYNPYFIELADSGDCVRVYVEVKDE